jgi:hypothetical protein
VLQSHGPLGDLYWSRKDPSLLVTKYKTRNMEKTVEVVARIHRAAEALISSSEVLSSNLELLPVLEMGHDFIVKPFHTSGTHLERMSDDHGERHDHPDKILVLALHDQTVREIQQGCTDEVLRDILLNTLAMGSRHVLWSTKLSKFIVPDLLITEAQVNDFTPDDSSSA